MCVKLLFLSITEKMPKTKRQNTKAINIKLSGFRFIQRNNLATDSSPQTEDEEQKRPIN